MTTIHTVPPVPGVARGSDRLQVDTLAARNCAASFMHRLRLLGAASAVLFSFVIAPANAAFIGILPATPLGTDYRAYYDDLLDITWAIDGNGNGSDTWDNQVAWAAGLTIGGVSGWRLASMDVNGDGSVVDCTSGTETACRDNEYGHLRWYGEGTALAGGVTPVSPGPFNNVDGFGHWSGTESVSDPIIAAWAFRFNDGAQGINGKTANFAAWAVRTGNASVVPVPAAVWLFASGLMGLAGLARRKKT